jgi:hypothetical protein
MFGCYRKGDANDPDIYCAAVAAVLSRYSPAVVVYVTDPRTGLPGVVKWLPAVAEVKEACIERESYLNRLADFERRFANREVVKVTALPGAKKQPGHRANVRILKASPQYARLLEWTKTADLADWKIDTEAELWVSLDAIHSQPARARATTETHRGNLE